MRDDQEFIERRIVTGLIVSTEYLDRVYGFWQTALLESPELRTVADWCLEFYREYQEAPDSNIKVIFQSKENTLGRADQKYIEELLASMSDEYGRDTQFNAAYLYDQTVHYLKQRELERHNEEVQTLTESGRVEEAEQLVQSFTPTIVEDEDTGLDLSSEDALERVERAFSDTNQNVLSYPGALGRMWDEHLVRGGFVSFLAPEKRGKTFMLLELGLKAIRQKANVAFFECGDMTEEQILRRICVYVAQKSDKEKYCQERFKPEGDCVFNQLDLCDRNDRNCDHGIFEDVDFNTFFREQKRYVKLDTLMDKYEEYPDYRPCDSHGCMERKGAVWIKRVKATRPLTGKEAQTELKRFFDTYRRRFKLLCQPAGMTTVSHIRNSLDNWERYDGFVPDIIAIDYADLLSADDGQTSEFRHRQDHIWKGLRALSQERHALVLTATQADSNSYTQGRLSLSNFSEDKRKLSHVTAQYGLNQDPQGREKELGLLRVNEIVVREGEFSADHEATVLQDLAAGRPFLESY